MNFFIFALPRSRTAWCANLMTWGSAFCHHELSAEGSLDEFEARMRSRVLSGSAETNLLQYLAIRERFPGARYAFLARDPEKVRQSLGRLGLPCPDVLLDLAIEVSDHIQARGGLLLDVDAWEPLSTRLLWNHCIPEEPFPEERCWQLEWMNVQITSERWGYLKEVARGHPPLLER